MPGDWAVIRIPRSLYDQWLEQRQRVIKAAQIEGTEKSVGIDAFEQVTIFLSEMSDEEMQRRIGGR